MAEDSKRIIAIGDIHGCADELTALLEQLPLDDATIVFLGDYIDRGPHSRRVVDLVIETSQKHDVVALMGNHEELLFDFLDRPDSARAGAFIYNGGSATLANYADDHGNFEFPTEHLEFFRSLRLTWETDDYFFVHAGVPNVPLNEIDPERHRGHLLWARDGFFRSKHKWDKIIIHGHTPVTSVHVADHRINLDTGCVYNNFLSAIVLPTMEIFQVAREGGGDPTFLRDKYSARRAVRFKGAVAVVAYRNNELFELETLDYNELGMFVRDISEREQGQLQKNEIITGEIRVPEAPLPFKGEVLRSQARVDGIYYAIRILSSG